MSDRDAAKLPVPAAWQAPVRAAVADLAARLGIDPVAIAPTRVETGAGPAGRDLAVWLMARGRTWRYVADPSGARVDPETGAAGTAPAG